MCETLLGCHDRGLNDLYRSAAVEGYAETFCCALDKVGMECSSAGIAARTLANIADVLGAMSRGAGGLRSGPACNNQWDMAFQLLEAGDMSRGFAAMAAERQNWMTQPGHLVRAARHYEGAAQILIRHAVMTARQFIWTNTCDLPAMDKWVMAECPARVDVAGGWSDTPPITYEHGGAVVNVAITVDGKKPVGARARRIDDLKIILHVQDDAVLVITDLEDLRDYNQQYVPGALLKAALICAGIAVLPSDDPLDIQLRQKYGSGFEIEAWSNLPHGSGLGISSILAGAIIAVLWRASGKLFDIKSLNHAVLHVEQMLTTGGGWQDQVGGLARGIKIGHSEAQLPLMVDVTLLDVADETVRAFGNQLVLIYTGKTRLARNLLQNVIRNWYARNPDIVSIENRLVANAWECAKAFEQGDLAGVGRFMSEYWQLKKLMAPGCEPQLVTRMMQAIESRVEVLGMSLAGAGGGGFMYLLTKQPTCADVIRQVLSELEGAEGAQVYAAAVDSTGLVLTIEGDGQQHIPLTFSVA
jgi:fucokinase